MHTRTSSNANTIIIPKGVLSRVVDVGERGNVVYVLYIDSGNPARVEK